MGLFDKVRHDAAVSVTASGAGIIVQGERDVLDRYTDMLNAFLAEPVDGPMDGPIDVTGALVDETVQPTPGPDAAITLPDPIVAPEPKPRLRISTLAVPAAVAADLAATVKAGAAEYVQFSPESKRLLETYGVIPTGDGHFRSMIRNETQIVGNLDWKPVAFNPEQALALQSAATHLALTAAINDLTKAVERVEGKVDKIVKLLRAERLGKALGDQRTLQPMVDKVRRTGSISRTDWSTIDTLGALITRDVEVLRAYLRGEVEDSQARPFVKPRSSELEDLTDDLFGEALALLVVVEGNFMMWHELKFAQVATHEPEALAEMIRDTTSEVGAFAAADQALVSSIYDEGEALLRSTGYEGFVPFERRRLVSQAEKLNEQLDWFCARRNLDVQELAVDLPSFRGSVGKVSEQLKTGTVGVVEVAFDGAKGAAAAVRSAPEKVVEGAASLLRGSDDENAPDDV